ncbi:MAG: galactose ABC transporter substrate-binding protein [Bacilli bacterium]|nr:galactose ABC transporter substrate-binding protein [Bacilli bacterium]
MKKVLIILSVIFLMSISACTSYEYKVGFLIYNEEDTFISEFEEIFFENKNPKIDYLVRYASNSQSIQNKQIVDLIDEGCKVLVINAVDRLAGGTIIKKAKQYGVKIIFFNREPVESDMKREENAFYVGSDPVDAGLLQAELATSLFGSPEALNEKYDKNKDNIIQVLILKGEQGHQDAEKRTDSNIKYLESHGYQVEILKTMVANWTKEEGYQAMQAAIELYGNSIELIFSNNDDMAKGAIDYLLEAGLIETGLEAKNQQFIIIGVDATDVGINCIEEGLMYGTVLNDSKNQVEAINALLDYIRSEKDLGDFPFEITNNNYIYLKGKIITKENINEIKKK